MKTRLLVCCILIVMLSAAANAGTYTFVPNPIDIGDLSHDYYYAWMISWTPPVGEVICGAVLTATKINNQPYEPNKNWLYINLLDSQPRGGTKVGSNVWRWYDGAKGGNNWAGQGVWVATYTDNTRGYENLSYDLAALGHLDTLNAFAADGVFGIGLDPDCSYHHYPNCGWKLKITTCPVPEPSSLLVLAGGLLPLGTVARRLRNRKH